MGKFRDLRGQTWGLLTFLEPLRADDRRRTVWSARCACGKAVEVAGARVTSGHVSSCGCLAVNRPADIQGAVFGRLRAMYPTGTGNTRAFMWVCECACGAVVEINGTKLRNGHTRSCGCLAKDTASELNRSHGMSGTTTYSAWLAMWARCTNSNGVGWHNYGGRGIKVCARWRKFENFLKDMGERPESLTLERVNNDKGYSPGNCTWATRAEQNRNQRRWKRPRQAPNSTKE